MLTIDKARGILSRGWWCDDRRARIELDYAPTMGLDDGVADTLRALADEEAAADRSAG
jgi:nucleoside-diphosphate-sugar epimerase